MQTGAQLGQRPLSLLHLHLDGDLVGVVLVFAEIPTRPVAQLDAATFVRHFGDGAEYVAVEFEHLLAEHKLGGWVRE